MTPDPTLIEQAIGIVRDVLYRQFPTEIDANLLRAAADEIVTTLQGSAALPSEVMMLQAAKDWVAAALEPMLNEEGYANPAHFDAMGDAERRLIAAHKAMRATTPTAPANPFTGPRLSEAELDEVERAMTGAAPVQDDDAELVKRIDLRIMEHRAHIAALQSEYGRGEVPDERNAGIVVNFGDLLDLRSRLSPTPETGPVERYNELISAVSKKHEGETRHETALRYIRQFEDRDNSALSNVLPGEDS